MSGLWHSVREVPERNRWVLVSFPDGAFAMEHLVSEKAWLYILEKCDQGVKWLYCDELVEREYPQELKQFAKIAEKVCKTLDYMAKANFDATKKQNQIKINNH